MPTSFPDCPVYPIDSVGEVWYIVCMDITNVETRHTYRPLAERNPWTTEVRITFADGSRKGIKYSGKLTIRRARAAAQNTADNYPMCLGDAPAWEA